MNSGYPNLIIVCFNASWAEWREVSSPLQKNAVVGVEGGGK